MAIEFDDGTVYESADAAWKAGAFEGDYEGYLSAREAEYGTPTQPQGLDPKRLAAEMTVPAGAGMIGRAGAAALTGPAAPIAAPIAGPIAAGSAEYLMQRAYGEPHDVAKQRALITGGMEAVPLTSLFRRPVNEVAEQAMQETAERFATHPGSTAMQAGEAAAGALEAARRPVAARRTAEYAQHGVESVPMAETRELAAETLAGPHARQAGPELRHVVRQTTEEGGARAFTPTEAELLRSEINDLVFGPNARGMTQTARNQLEPLRRAIDADLTAGGAGVPETGRRAHAFLMRHFGGESPVGKILKAGEPEKIPGKILREDPTVVRRAMRWMKRGDPEAYQQMGSWYLEAMESQLNHNPQQIARALGKTKGPWSYDRLRAVLGPNGARAYREIIEDAAQRKGLLADLPPTGVTLGAAAFGAGVDQMLGTGGAGLTIGAALGGGRYLTQVARQRLLLSDGGAKLLLRANRILKRAGESQVGRGAQHIADASAQKRIDLASRAVQHTLYHGLRDLGMDPREHIITIPQEPNQ